MAHHEYQCCYLSERPMTPVSLETPSPAFVFSVAQYVKSEWVVKLLEDDGQRVLGEGLRCQQD